MQLAVKQNFKNHLFYSGNNDRLCNQQLKILWLVPKERLSMAHMNHLYQHEGASNIILQCPLGIFLHFSPYSLVLIHKPGQHLRMSCSSYKKNLSAFSTKKSSVLQHKYLKQACLLHYNCKAPDKSGEPCFINLKGLY